MNVQIVDARELAGYFEGKGKQSLARIFRNVDDYMPLPNALSLARHNGYSLKPEEISKYITTAEEEKSRKLTVWRMNTRIA